MQTININYNWKHLFNCYGWLITAISCLILGYLLIWQRGLYLDDYSISLQFQSFTFSNFINLYLLNVRGFNNVILVLIAFLPTHEFWLRLFYAAISGSSALLLGSLVYRLLQSKLAGIITGWLYLMPFFAQETSLWATANGYIVATNFLLISLHAFLNVVIQQRFFSYWFMIGIISFMLTLLIVEQHFLIMGFLPIMAGIITNQYTGKAVRQSLFILIGLVAITGILYISIYHNSGLVQSRGGLIDINFSSLFTRTQQYFNGLHWLLFAKDMGLALTTEAFTLGYAIILQSCFGLALFIIASITLTLTVNTWQTAPQEYAVTYKNGYVVLAIGITWFIATFLFPAILVKNQGLAPRIIYLPLAGSNIAIATIAWLSAKRLQHLIWYPRLLLGGIGTILLLSTVTMLGYAQVYLARSQLDQHQLTTLLKTLPSQYVPPGSYIIPYNKLIDSHMFDKYHTLNKILLGVLDAPWSAAAALKMLYQRDNIQSIVANRWTKIQFNYTCGQQPASNILNVQNQDVPIDKIIMFSYQAGIVYIIDKLSIPSKDRNTIECVIEFTIATQLKQRNNVPTMGVVAEL